jgi:DNA replication protein DnaC
MASERENKPVTAAEALQRVLSGLPMPEVDGARPDFEIEDPVDPIAEIADMRARQMRAKLEVFGWPTRALEIAAAADLERPALKAIRGWDHRSGGALVISGGIGVGKTVAAAWIAADRGLRCSFLRAAEFARTSRYDAEAFGAVLGAAALCLDDLGSEWADERGSLRVSLDELIDRFYAERRVLIVTTNLGVAELTQRYGERAVDRLREWATWAHVGGKSMRGRK